MLAYRKSKFNDAKRLLKEEENLLMTEACPEISYIDNYYVLGLVYSETDMHDSAVVYFLKALKLAEESGNREMESKVYHSLSGIHAKLKEFSKAEDRIKLAIKINRETKNYFLMANNYSTLSSVFVALEQTQNGKHKFLDSAMIALDTAYAFARRSYNRDAILSVYYKKATLF